MSRTDMKESTSKCHKKKFRDMLGRIGPSSASPLLNCLYFQKRNWYKKGEFRISRPHGISETSFRPGDRWGWLKVCRIIFYFHLIRIIMSTLSRLKRKCITIFCTAVRFLFRKKVRRKTPYTYASDFAAQHKKEKVSHFKSQYDPKS